MQKIVYSLFFILTFNLYASDKNSKEAVSNLKAYALYKMGKFDEAKVIWDVLAEKGNTTALINISNLYEHGFGVNEDKKIALKYVTKAAHLGDERSQYELGINYEKGLYLKRDIKKAEYWLEKSAKNGSIDGIRAYSILLATGKGKGFENLSDEERKKALKWLYVAKENHIQEVNDYIQLIEDNKKNHLK